MQKFKDTLEGKGKILFAALLINFLNLFRRFAKYPNRYWASWNELIQFQAFAEETFDTKRVYINREMLWKRMLRLMPEEFSALEFGVANGYLTNYWMKRGGNRIKTWNGYDTFTGLPRAWRDLPQNYFDTGGMVPAITDDRVTWHVGLVQETLSATFTPPSNLCVCYFFDFDLFEPSFFAWNIIKSQLKIGDFLYFDEAFDSDEKRLITEHVLKFGTFELVGVTPLAMAVRLKNYVATSLKQ